MIPGFHTRQRILKILFISKCLANGVFILFWIYFVSKISMKERNCISECSSNCRVIYWHGPWICYTLSHRQWFSCELDWLRKLHQSSGRSEPERYFYPQTPNLNLGLYFNWYIHFESTWNACYLWSRSKNFPKQSGTEKKLCFACT